MIISLGADHRGFPLKERIKAFLKDQGYTVNDLGAAALVPDDDYPRYAAAVASEVSKDPVGTRGIVICGSGFGVAIAANKFTGVRAALAMSPDHVYQGRHDDDVNVLALAADFVSEEEAFKIVRTFLATAFDDKDERYARRLREIGAIEAGKTDLS